MSRFSHRRILVVGEGRETEYNYFVGFRTAFKADIEATATSLAVRRGKGGDARGIVETAIKEERNFQPDRKRGDRVFLLLDTEGAGRAPELQAAERLAKKNQIEIVYSCPSFEYWLLCHFDKPSRGNFKNAAMALAALNKKWRGVCNTEYDKADQDVFDRLSDQLATAREQALEIDLHHHRTVGVARRTNPSTQVYELIAILVGAQTGEKCPLADTWRLVANPDVAVDLGKGDQMPHHDNNPAHWKL